MLKLLSLFSGIGAFEKALENLCEPFEIVRYCEIDKYASKAYSLIHNLDENMNLKDVCSIDTNELPGDIDFITYGFPCQDISQAGKGKGFTEEDGSLTRSGLFFEALRIIDETKPKIAIAENVKALVGKRFTAEFKIVLDSLNEAGYTNYWAVLNAKDYGIPQNRERVFIISIRKDIEHGFEFPKPYELKLRLKDLLEDSVDQKYYLSDKMIQGFLKHNENHEAKGTGFKWKPKNGDDIANCLRANAALCPTDNTIDETPQNNLKITKNYIQWDASVKQIGNLFPGKKRANPNQGRIYDKNGLSPTLNTMQGGNLQPFIIEEPNKDALPIKEATKQGYKEAHEGDYVNLEYPNSKTRRGRVGEQVANTLLCNNGNGVVVKNEFLRIRKLTPKECFRLMGFDDADVDVLIENKTSNTQLYKMAGNSIVVDVLEEIFVALLNQYENVFPIG